MNSAGLAEEDSYSVGMAVFGFPNPVNEKAARTVAAGVALLAATTLLTGWHWIIAIMAVGFLARVLTGPKLSVLGQLATKVVAPRLGMPRFVPGPPKRFAQAIGLALTSVAAISSLVFGAHLPATAFIGARSIFATLESVVGFCAGCWLFARLMAVGLIPAEVCEACTSFSAAGRVGRLAQALSAAPIPGRSVERTDAGHPGLAEVLDQLDRAGLRHPSQRLDQRARVGDDHDLRSAPAAPDQPGQWASRSGCRLVSGSLSTSSSGGRGVSSAATQSR